ncbi:MAG TPA: tetratricopeptide repeat protein, partial [Flavobacteriaceae bacterium]|nr:tetratricopeptide repeat protein [Flavobacteriaceae bacterium]
MKKPLLLICFFISFLSFSQTKEIDSLTIQLAFQNADSTKVETSIHLIKALYQSKEYDQALKYINQTEKLTNTLNYSSGLADIFHLKAKIYSENGDYINAVNTYKKTKQLFLLAQDTLGVAKVNSNIGLIEIERGNYKDGLQYSLSAIKELEKRNLKLELCSTYKNLATAYYKIQDYDKAIEFNVKNLEIEEELKHIEGMFSAYNNLANLYSMRKENRKAIEYYEKALNMPFSNNDSIRGEILPKLGGEYLQFKDYEKASGYLVEGLQINRKLDNKEALLPTLNNLGKLNFEQNRYKLAESQLLEAQAIGTAFEENSDHLANYKLLKTLDSISRNFDRAFVWQRKYYELKNKLHPAKPAPSTFDIDAITESLVEDSAKDTISELNAAKEEIAKKQEFDKLQLIFYALLAALAIVSTFLVLIYLKRNSRLKYTRDLEEKNRKIELQNEAIMEQAKHL